MNQQDPSWLSWVAPTVVVLGALWATLKWLFVATVRSEMTSMHQENQERFQEIEKSLAKISGRLDERWGERE
jgi:hypothetical protein